MPTHSQVMSPSSVALVYSRVICVLEQYGELFARFLAKFEHRVPPRGAQHRYGWAVMSSLSGSPVMPPFWLLPRANIARMAKRSQPNALMLSLCFVSSFFLLLAV